MAALRVSITFKSIIRAIADLLQMDAYSPVIPA